MKKLLIIRPVVDDSDPAVTHYQYPNGYVAEHASHICYNRSNKALRGGFIGEGMVIYTADKAEIEALCQQPGVEEVTHGQAKTMGKVWQPAEVIEGKERPEFDIEDWVKSEDIGG